MINKNWLSLLAEWLKKGVKYIGLFAEFAQHVCIFDIYNTWCETDQRVDFINTTMLPLYTYVENSK